MHPSGLSASTIDGGSGSGGSVFHDLLAFVRPTGYSPTFPDRMSECGVKHGRHGNVPSVGHRGFLHNGAVSEFTCWLSLGDERAQDSHVAKQAAERKRAVHGGHVPHRLLYNK